MINPQLPKPQPSLPTDPVLLVSCFGDRDTGGGLFQVDGRSVIRLDRLSTTGLAVAGDRLLRLLRSERDIRAAGELLVYDDRGVSKYYRLDDVIDAHDVLWDGTHFVCVSTMTNSIVWIDESGRIARRWNPGPTSDSWHVNSLTLRGDSIIASAFGRFDNHREWTSHKMDGSGLLFDVSSNALVMDGLCCPHNPRFLDDNELLVCNSARGELLQLGLPSGNVQKRAQLLSWTRGLAVSRDHIYVGESDQRMASATMPACHVVVLSRTSWEVMDRIPLPCRDIHDLVLVPSATAAGVRRGFQSNPRRVAEQAQYTMFSEVGIEPIRLWGEPLPRSACKIRVTCEPPAIMLAGSVVEVECSLLNTGPAVLVTAPPHPVLAAYKWFDGASGTRISERGGLRSQLPRPLHPNDPVNCRIRVRAPNVPGKYVLKVTLLQDGVGWFDEFDATNCMTAAVVVVPAEPAISEGIE